MEVTCLKCGISKPTSEFYFKDVPKKRMSSRCKRCQINQQREKSLGVTEDDYQRMLAAQDDSCAVCGLRIEEYRTKYNRYTQFSVDHNHSTGEVRGLLCHNCNRALGMLQDDPEILWRAVSYLER